METKENKGVTLIALAVTIIVMLILAGVTISALAGNSGITTKAKQAKNVIRSQNRRRGNKTSSNIYKYAKKYRRRKYNIFRRATS